VADAECRILSNGKQACLVNASSALSDEQHQTSYSLYGLSNTVDNASSSQCASFSVRCMTCFEPSKSKQIAPCAEGGNPDCTWADTVSAAYIPWLGALSSENCKQLQDSSNQDVFSNVLCCSTDGCNFRDAIPANSPPGAPPALPGSGPCELPDLTWEEVVARDEISSWSGGLGLLSTPVTGVWVCLTEPTLPSECGGFAGDGGGEGDNGDNSTLPDTNSSASNSTDANETAAAPGFAQNTSVGAPLAFSAAENARSTASVGKSPVTKARAPAETTPPPGRRLLQAGTPEPLRMPAPMPHNVSHYASGGGSTSYGGGTSYGELPPRPSDTFPEMPCYTFNEILGVFVFWGRNADLRLLSLAQISPGP